MPFMKEPTLNMPRTAWGELNRRAHATTATTFSRFLQQAEVELRKTKTPNFDILEVQPFAEEGAFAAWARVVEEIQGEHAPMLTWHGSSPANIAKIARNGYVLPGDVDPDTGEMLWMAHGSAYGDGVYTSTFFEKSQDYSFLDQEGCSTVLVNAVAIGNVKFLQLGKKYSYLTCTSDWTWKHVYHSDEVDANDPAEYHTLALPDLREVISPRPQAVLPLFKVTLQHHARAYAKPNRVKPPTFDSDEPRVRFVRLARDVYSLQFPVPPNATTEAPAVCHYVVAPSAASNSAAVARALDNFFATLRVEGAAGSAVFYDKAVHVHENVETHTPWSALAGQHRVHSASELRHQVAVEAFESALALCVAGHDRWMARVDKTPKHTPLPPQPMFAVYLFVQAPSDMERTVDICTRWGLAAGLMLSVRIVYLQSPASVNPGEQGEGNKQLLENHGEMRGDAFVVDLRQSLVPHMGLLKNMQTTSTVNEEFWHVAETVDVLEAVLGRVLVENRSLTFNRCELSIPYPLGAVGEGFITNITDGPQWKVSHYTALLFKGRKLPYIEVDGEPMPLSFGDARMNVQSAVENVLPLLSQFRNYVAGNKTRHLRYQAFVSTLAEGVMKTADEEMKRLSLLRDKAKTPAEREVFVREIRAARSLYVRLTQILSDISAFAGVSLAGPWFERLSRMRFAKAITKRVKFEADLGKLAREMGVEKVEDAMDALAVCELAGPALRLIRTGASEIEPWLVMVDHVYPVNTTVRDIFWKAEYDQGEPIEVPATPTTPANAPKNDQDALLLDERLDTETAKLAYGYMFTLNPHLYLPGQPVALLVVTWVHVIETMFRACAAATPPAFDDVLTSCRLCLSLTRRVLAVLPRLDTVSRLLDRVVEENDFESLLTEAQGVVSVCTVLACLLDKKRLAAIHTAGRFSRFAFAVLAEAVVRSCRANQRSKGATENAVIRQILGIDESSTPDTYVFNLDKATARTTKFYFKRFTNCSPFAVVGVLGFVDMLMELDCTSFETLEEPITRAFVEKRISMRMFLEQHGGSDRNNGKALQVALFLEGTKNHRSSSRGPQLHGADSIISTHVAEQLAMVGARQRGASRAADRRLQHAQKREMLAVSYTKYHVMPHIFTEAEVAELNKGRPASDRLELMPSGMLRYHCCYPACPMYLYSFKKPASNSRNHLFNHLDLSINVLRNFVPGFHALTLPLLRSPNMTFQHFCERVEQHYTKQHAQWWAGEHTPSNEECLRLLWEDRERLLRE